MQVDNTLDHVDVFTGAGGADRTIKTPPSNAALNAKTLILFLEVHEVDGDTQIEVFLDDSADGQEWRTHSTALISTSGAASTGVYGGHTTDPFGAWTRFKVKVSKTAGTDQLNAQISLKAVWKPF